MNKYLLLIFFLISNFQKVFSEKKPNIVIIMLDDMGYGDIESFGAIDYYTPNINKLADNDPGSTFITGGSKPTPLTLIIFSGSLGSLLSNIILPN